MAYLADFKCEKCETVFFDIMFKSYDDFNKNKSKLLCEKCKSKLQNVMLFAPRIEVKETNEVFSAKPSGYWRNAEKVKQQNIRKRKEEEAEKVFYKDPETMKKIKNKKINEARFAED